MIQFSSLRLNGFKSFVDKTELDIGPGLNGIVGPNGCGKSNLVEALRWVMGESSAKRMRGSGMEDVIFSGTDQRSARNFAEVSLLLNNASREAPAAYNSNDDIEVVRRIEKDKGSGYKINGKNARARDVQMLFADTVTGANSPSMVSQGHITRMINAKPQERRLVLEESAGVAGLYARRHEAEIRLKAADTNLIRVEDILGSMESRLNSLKRQSRQAARYKNLNAQIRQLELVIMYLEWRSLLDKKEQISKDFGMSESLVAEKLAAVTQLTKTQNTQIEDLPPLRRKEAELSAKLQKLKLEFQRLESEAERYLNDVQDTKTQLHQTQVDKQHEEQTLEETSKLLEQIEIEHKDLLEKQSEEENTHKQKQEIKDELRIKVIELEERFTALKESAAEGRARKEALKKQIERHQENMDTLLKRKERATEEKETLVLDEKSLETIKNLEERVATFEAEIESLNSESDISRKSITLAEEQLNKARGDVSEIERKEAEFTAEISVLESIFQDKEDQNYIPVMDTIETKEGFEKALSRALGNTLLASLDENAPTRWASYNKSMKLEDLPSGCKSLLPHVKAPEELHITLRQIGFVENEDDGNALASKLKPGQALVSANGTYWRWDGYQVQAHATDNHTVQLEQKNKLKTLLQEQERVLKDVKSAKDQLNKHTDAYNEAKENYSELLASIKEKEQKLSELRPALHQIKEKNVRIESEQKRFDDQIKTLDEDISKLKDALDKDQISYETLVQNEEKEQDNEEDIAKTKEILDATKHEYQEAVRAFDILEQSQSTRRARIQAIADERVSLKNRSIRAAEHLKKLTERTENLTEKLEALESQPVNVESGHEEMLSTISDTEREKDKATEMLVTCEEEVSSTTKALKEAEALLGNAREDRARHQAMLSAANEQLTAMERSIEEQLNMPPKELVNHAAMDLVKHQTSDLPKLKDNKEQLIRDRESIGPVNLRAEEETNELEKELTTLLHERNDLIQAIEELRGAINKINKEAKERLENAFNQVNAHFQNLFVRLFKGGKAYLELQQNPDDPMESGLEIFAQPPGKALQSLSLLSGGEQTLTSIALIFAMFLTNPSPICVLDEIDAPLDDANVDRVCDLLEEIAERGETRFLIITHHRLTMARMDRLYGVTMSEKGVSQLVSVDLQQSFDFIDKKVA